MNKIPSASILGFLLTALVILLNPGVLQAQSEGPEIHIEWPNEGETLYAAPTSLQYSAPVRGYVKNDEHVPASSTVRLRVKRDNKIIDSLSQALGDGTFEFLVTVNPHGSIENFPAENAGCGDDCHLPGYLDLAAGDMVFELTLISPQGELLASAERYIIVDHSTYATIPVELILQEQETNQETSVPAGVTVRGAAWLYMWRARHALTQSSASGRATLMVEASSQASTEYLVEVEPTIVDGVLYEGVENQRVTLAPGESDSEPITLTVRARRGEIEGRIIPSALENTNVYAVCLDDGHSLQAPIARDGAFHFQDVALERYRLVLDNQILSAAGLMQETPSPTVDLIASRRQDVTIPLAFVSSKLFSGQIRGEDQSILPFAWAMAENGARTHPVLPATGKFFWPDAPAERTTIIFQAPGYYSRATALVPASREDNDTFTLSPHPQTEFIPWGQGSITLPNDSDIERDGTTIVLHRGWLWGDGAADAPFTVHAGPHTIILHSGRFALEYLPPRRGWLYLLQGNAELVDGRNGRHLTVDAGHIVNLLNEDALTAVTYARVTVGALQERGISPLPQRWEQTVRARLRDGLARTGLGIAQIITFVTYILVCFSIIAGPVYALYLRSKRRKMHT